MVRARVGADVQRHLSAIHGAATVALDGLADLDAESPEAVVLFDAVEHLGAVCDELRDAGDQPAARGPDQRQAAALLDALRTAPRSEIDDLVRGLRRRYLPTDFRGTAPKAVAKRVAAQVRGRNTLRATA